MVIELLLINNSQRTGVMDEKIGSLEDEALKRKERLQALKRKNEETKENKNESSATKLPKPKFRSYKPQDETLKDNVLENAKPGDVESQVQEQLNTASTKVIIEDLDIGSLAPRKPDWDLKRDVAKKLEKLERRTQKAIAELIRDRLKQGQQDLAAVVNVASLDREDS